MGAILSSQNAGGNAGGHNDKKAFNAMALMFGTGVNEAMLKWDTDVAGGLKGFGSMGAFDMLCGPTNSSKGPLSAIFAGLFNKEDLFAYVAGGGGGGGGGEGSGGGGESGSNHAFSSVGSAAQDFASNATYEGHESRASLGGKSPQAGHGAGRSQEGAGMGA
jgi:hypothetical protein